MTNKYLFNSERLGFRNWTDADIPKMAEISSDPEVMEFFPATATPEQTATFITNMKAMFTEKGYCYFAVDELEHGHFIGFIGLCDQTYESEFTPCVDIGWRLTKKYWNRGFATEGAERCLMFAFDHLKLNNIKSVATMLNLKSIRVMEKIGMQKQLEFIHPKLSGDKRLERCVCYDISKEA